MKRLLIALGVLGASLAILAGAPAFAATSGTAWGVMPLAPSCGGGSCTLQLVASPGDLTIVYCEGGYYGPCSVIPAGSTVIVPITSVSGVLACSPVPVTALHAAGLPRWY